MHHRPIVLRDRRLLPPPREPPAAAATMSGKSSSTSSTAAFVPNSSSDSIGSLLAHIANLVIEGIQILSLSDKRHWGPDEHEQLRALEDVLDEAKKDFQGLSPLVNGQMHYQNDRTFDSVHELRSLQEKFGTHVSSLKDWSRTGGPIDPSWVRDTQALQRDLHRAQYRAAGRIFASGQESSMRCLGAFLVYRQQRASRNRQQLSVEEGAYQRRHMDELTVCNSVGGFHRHGDEDIAFVCDFCDGHMIWEDLERMPSVLMAGNDSTWTASPTTPVSPSGPLTPTTTSTTTTTTSTTVPTLTEAPANPQWQALGHSLTAHEEKQVVYAPVAIANHMVPHPGDWQSRISCPFCEDEADGPRDKDDEEDAWRPEDTFEDIVAFQEHLEWQHTVASTGTTTNDSCLVM